MCSRLSGSGLCFQYLHSNRLLECLLTYFPLLLGKDSKGIGKLKNLSFSGLLKGRTTKIPTRSEYILSALRTPSIAGPQSRSRKKRAENIYIQQFCSMVIQLPYKAANEKFHARCWLAMTFIPVLTSFLPAAFPASSNKMKSHQGNKNFRQ